MALWQASPTSPAPSSVGRATATTTSLLVVNNVRPVLLFVVFVTASRTAMTSTKAGGHHHHHHDIPEDPFKGKASKNFDFRLSHDKLLEIKRGQLLCIMALSHTAAVVSFPHRVPSCLSAFL